MNSQRADDRALRAGDGEAVFVCADGYTDACRRGQRNGRGALRPASLCGVNHLSAAIVMGSRTNSSAR
ncbi:MAG: hypothetical protein ACLS6G_01715 [Christensenellales bacterium]